MKPAAFDYVQLRSIKECLEVLATDGDDACLIAGGQSLLPALAFRLRTPKLLADINRIPELAGGILVRDDVVRVAALTCHAELAESVDAHAYLPLLHAAAPHIAHVAIRHRGTLGGSIALGDPAAELPACAVALQASVVLASRARGERRVAAEDFFRALYDTERLPDELIIACEFPRIAPDHVIAFREIARRSGDYATVGLAAAARRCGNGLSHTRIVFFGVSDRPVHARLTSGAVDASRTAEQAVRAGGAQLSRDFEPIGDLWHSAAAKAHLCRVILEDALQDLYAAR